jgi:hypothetical protein
MEVIMNVNTVINKANNFNALNNQEIEVLMLHALDLLKQFNKITQNRIDEVNTFRAEQNRLPLAA